ncbi:MAG: tRNA 2-selenouridine(34) synthase MnmH [Ginsengibacter sp.]
MAVKNIPVDEFVFDNNKPHIIIDVRSPSEFSHAHMPGAISIPLFSDEERKIVGTAYKQQSRQAAIKIGLDFYGLKMKKVVEEVEAAVAQYNTKLTGSKTNISIYLHCWRGGMRSAAVAWLLDLYGFVVFTLSGGYKSYRAWVLKMLTQPLSFKVLGGFTGSGKTELLQYMQINDEAVLNLENLANHKGSAFGALGIQEQPSQEMFENAIAAAIHEITKNGINRCIWVEDESQRIGKVIIPLAIFENMRQSPLYFLDIPFEERLKNIIQTYGSHSADELASCISRISNRLGGLETKLAINFLFQDNVTESFRILLNYYDKWYGKGLQNRKTLPQNIYKIPCETITEENFKKLAL